MSSSVQVLASPRWGSSPALPRRSEDVAGKGGASGVASNGGGYAESMAEHALAMALAAAKRLVLEHENLKRGQFNQFTRNRMLAGRLCGILGFGGIGAATARLMHGVGMRVHAINRHGRTDQRVDWIGTPEQLSELLEVADILLISA